MDIKKGIKQLPTKQHRKTGSKIGDWGIRILETEDEMI